MSSLMSSPIVLIIRAKSGATYNAPMAFAIAERAGVIIARQADVDPATLTFDTRFVEDLGFDSLDSVELLLAFEEEFGIEIPDEEAPRLRTVGDAIRYLETHVPEGN